MVSSGEAQGRASATGFDHSSSIFTSQSSHSSLSLTNYALTCIEPEGYTFTDVIIAQESFDSHKFSHRLMKNFSKPATKHFSLPSVADDDEACAEFSNFIITESDVKIPSLVWVATKKRTENLNERVREISHDQLFKGNRGKI